VTSAAFGGGASAPAGDALAIIIAFLWFAYEAYAPEIFEEGGAIAAAALCVH